MRCSTLSERIAVTSAMLPIATVLLLSVTSSMCVVGSGVDCDFERSMCGYTGTVTAQRQWTRNAGPTGSANTGPDFDHTFMNSSGHYMYVEASNVAHGSVFDLVTPPFDPTDDATVTFFYHMRGSGVGELSLLLRSENGAGGHNDSMLWHRAQEAGPDWLEANVTLTSRMAASTPVNLVFRVAIGTSYLSDIAIDDVTMTLPPTTTVSTPSTPPGPSTPPPPQTTQVNVKVTHDVSVSATPTSVHENFTKTLTVNCTYTHHPDSDFSTLVSLLLTLTSAGITRELATLTAFSHDAVTVKNGLGAQISGVLHPDGSSAHITLTWLYPADEVIGEYRCEGFGLDVSGHPRTSAALTHVTPRPLDCDVDVLPGFKATDLAIDALKVKVHKSLNSFFTASTTYLNHTYFLSGPVIRNVQMCVDLCSMYGGHLAELTSQAEFTAVVNFTQATLQGADFGVVALGGTDAGHEGQWTTLSSGVNMTYFAWADLEPTAALHEDCLFLTGAATLRMDDGVCEGASLIRALCELEQ